MRVLTLNVRNPQPARLGDLVDFLNRSEAEVLVLTEIKEEAASKLATLLGCAGFAHAYAPYWGNCLLSRTFPVRAARTIELTPSTDREVRSAVYGEVAAPWGDLQVVGTHLACGSEDDRLRQIHDLAAATDLSHSLLMGDLNALCRNDYSDQRWQDIERQRKAAFLTPPESRVTDYLMNSLNLSDAVQTNANRELTQPTCKHGTRVDYVLLGEHSGVVPVSNTYKTLAAMALHLTDHDAVAVDIESQT